MASKYQTCCMPWSYRKLNKILEIAIDEGSNVYICVCVTVVTDFNNVL